MAAAAGALVSVVVGDASAGRGAVGGRIFGGKLARTGPLGVREPTGFGRPVVRVATGGEAWSAGSTRGSGAEPVARRLGRSAPAAGRRCSDCPGAVRAAAPSVLGGGPDPWRRSVARPLAGTPSDPS